VSTKQVDDSAMLRHDSQGGNPANEPRNDNS
jgi:hypothetical protein